MIVRKLTSQISRIAQDAPLTAHKTHQQGRSCQVPISRTQHIINAQKCRADEELQKTVIISISQLAKRPWRGSIASSLAAWQWDVAMPLPLLK